MENQTTIKLSLNDDIRRIRISPRVSYSDLVKTVHSLYKNEIMENATITFKYRDDEKDMCSITSDEELWEAFVCKNDSILKVEITVNEPLPFFSKATNPRCPMGPRREKRMMRKNHHDEGIAFMDSKDYIKAREAFEKQLVETRCPWRRSVPLYNIACCEALLGNADSALSFLSQAIENGYRNREHILQDEDLISLRGLSAFQELVSELTENLQKRPFVRCAPIVLRRGDTKLVEIKPIDTTPVETKPAETQPVEPKPDEIKPVEIKPDEMLEPKEEIGPVNPIEVTQEKPESKSGDDSLDEFSAWKASLQYLADMGFTDQRRNLKALYHSNGDLGRAVEYLLR